ncbi:MAG: hypothetical protein Tsb009_11030 [Planctomycetaceae bacterium]
MLQMPWKQVFAALLLVLAASGDRTAIVAQNAPVPNAQANSGMPPEESPLLVEPKTQEEFFRAAVLMHRIARPKLAKHYLQKLMDTKPTDADLLKLRDKFGPGNFLRLAAAKELKPLSTNLLARVNAAFRKRGADPKYIDSLLDDLNGTVRERDVAKIILKNTGAIVVPRILERVAKTESAQQIAVLQETLIYIGEPAVPPLLAAIDSPIDSVRSIALSSVGWIGVRDAAPYLWYAAFNEKELKGVRLTARRALARLYKTSATNVQQTAPANVVAELKRHAIMHFKGEYPWKVAAGQKVNLWVWDTNAQTVKGTQVTPRYASLFIGTRFAKQALNLSPASSRNQALFLAMSLASVADPKWERSLPTGPGTVHDMALTAGTKVVKDALEMAMKYGNSASAVAALIVLRQIATKADLKSGSPILAALNDPHQRVRFAAASSILHIDPDRKFRGSHRVISILTRALLDDGSPKGLVINTNSQTAGTLAGFLGDMGYAPFISQTGRDGFRVASARSDIDLVIMQLNTIRWPLSQTLANFRADARTSRIPIAIYGPADMRHRVITQLEKYPRLTYVVESNSSGELSEQLNAFLKTVKSEPLTAKQRAEQKAAAAYWLAQIASGHRSKLYDLRPAEKALIGALNDPALAENAALALGVIPSKPAQIAIQELALNPRFNARIRETATLQLAYHIQKFGLLMEDKHVLQVKQALAAAGNTPELATALASVMGSLKPNAKRVGSHLLKLPLPKPPAGN